MSNEKFSGASRPSRSQDLGFSGLTEAIVQTMDQPLLLLRSDLVVEDANSAFYRLLKVDAEETRGRPFHELGAGQWNVPELRRLLEQILPQQSVVEHYRIEHKFPEIGKRVMILNARRLPADGERPETILLRVANTFS